MRHEMDLRPWTWTTALLLALGLGLSTAARADRDEDDDDERGERGEHEHDEHGERGWDRTASRSSAGAPAALLADDPLVAAECGSCHLAYSPSLLPARSWIALMGGLSDHFGDNAELPPEQVQQITAWLIAHAADTGPATRLGARVTRSVSPQDTPLRILDVPWLAHEHGEIPSRLVRDNPDIPSMSACESCHSGAAQGRFSEHEVSIPGVGRWDD